MSSLSFTECFAKYGAKLTNPMWAVSAKATDGAIVISCWANYFSRPDKDTLRYTDTLSRWAGNVLGNNLLREHIILAQNQALPVRLVVATAKNASHVDAGLDASKISKTFHVRPEVEGRLISFDGDEFVIDFCRSTNSLNPKPLRGSA
jgi:hypothetical protein